MRSIAFAAPRTLVARHKPPDPALPDEYHNRGLTDSIHHQEFRSFCLLGFPKILLSMVFQSDRSHSERDAVLGIDRGTGYPNFNKALCAWPELHWDS